jgi:hypothetical protein
MSGDEDPDANLWNALAGQRRAAERTARQQGVPPRAVRRMAVRHRRASYPRVLVSVAVEVKTGSVLFYLPGAEHTAHFRCPRDDALSTFVNADPTDAHAGFRVVRRDGDTFVVEHHDISVRIDRTQRAEIVAMLMP